jgi:hypothetical protein
MDGGTGEWLPPGLLGARGREVHVEGVFQPPVITPSQPYVPPWHDTWRTSLDAQRKAMDDPPRWTDKVGESGAALAHSWVLRRIECTNSEPLIMRADPQVDHLLISSLPRG